MPDLTTTHLKYLLEKATPGPWEYDPGEAPEERCIVDAETWNMCINPTPNGAGSSCSDHDLTLADLTPLELANHVGTWVNVPHKPHPVIYMGEFESTGEIKHGARIFDPRYGDNYCRLDDCTPRPDLPRAWAADGRPTAGEWEYAEYLGDYKGMTNVYHFDGEPTHRRFVGDWEEA